MMMRLSKEDEDQVDEVERAEEDDKNEEEHVKQSVGSNYLTHITTVQIIMIEISIHQSSSSSINQSIDGAALLIASDG